MHNNLVYEGRNGIEQVIGIDPMSHLDLLNPIGFQDLPTNEPQCFSGELRRL